MTTTKATHLLLAVCAGLFVASTGLFMAPQAHAQDYGFTLGFQQTTASTDTSGTSVDGVFNFKAGLLMDFEMVPMVKFRTGAVYDQRHVEWKDSAGDKTKVNFDYIDVPVDIQYNFNDMVGLFGGLNIGINVNDKADFPTGTSSHDLGAKAIIPLVNVGANFTFEDMFGFDLYYEHGLGEFADHLKDFSTFGGNFIYWF
jgi:hypothetical protein